MNENSMFSLLAVLQEINDRELKKKLAAFPEDQHYYATIASSIIGAENSKRIVETPEGVAENSEEFVSKLLEITSIAPDNKFRDILETFLIGTLKDELRFCCFNCIKFSKCADIEKLTVGGLFRRRAQGEDTPQLKAEISRLVGEALKKTPYLDTDDAHKSCSEFKHQYTVSNIGEVFGRYSDIASSLQKQFGIDYRKVQQQMIAINMTFVEKSREK